VSELGFGAWAIGGNEYGNSYGPTDDATSIDAIRVALDFGCNFFDTADVYGHGHSERLLGRALRDARAQSEVIIASKVGSDFTNGATVIDFSRRHIIHAIEGSLRRLERDYLDLYQLHNPPLETLARGEVFEALDVLRANGKIRHYGVSIHTIAEGLACIESGKAETLQMVYNLFSLLEALPLAQHLFSNAAEHDIGVIAREPLANGFLSGTHRVDTDYGYGDVRAEFGTEERKARVVLADSLSYLERSGVTRPQAALRFVLDEPLIATTIVGIKTPAQARENFRAVDLPSFEYLAGGDAEQCPTAAL
jgi:aryl-alcohol dehydrogenase-like predicted oxidoreductase